MRPPENRTSPERILTYGDAGTGKSWAWANIANAQHKADAPGTFYVIDTDRTTERMFDEGFGHLRDSGKVDLYNCFGWEDIRDAGKEIAKQAGRDDWIVIDMIDAPWLEVRNYFIEQVHGMDPEDYFLRTRKMIKEAQEAGRGHERQYGGSSGLDWDYITKMYLSWEKSITIKSNANVFAATSSSRVDERSNDTDEQKTYRIAGGVKPYGQKHLRHRFHTILYMNRTRDGWECTAVKDRNREEIWAEVGGRTYTIPMKRFSNDYLRKIAGWERPKKDK